MEANCFSMPSGAVLRVTPAPFIDAKALLKALLKTNVGIPLAQNPMDMDLTVLKDAVLAAATSDEVEALVFKCLERATYDGEKVRPQLFDEPATSVRARGDYPTILWRVVEVNCKPFFSGALSALKPFLPKQAGSPGSK